MPPDVLDGFLVFAPGAFQNRRCTNEQKNEGIFPGFRSIRSEPDRRTRQLRTTARRIAGIAKDTQTEQQSLVDVCYWPSPETFREDSDRKEMCYFTRPRNKYFVRVVFEKNTGRWQTEKFRGNKLIAPRSVRRSTKQCFTRLWTAQNEMSAEGLKARTASPAS